MFCGETRDLTVSKLEDCDVCCEGLLNICGIGRRKKKEIFEKEF